MHHHGITLTAPVLSSSITWDCGRDTWLLHLRLAGADGQHRCTARVPYRGICADVMARNDQRRLLPGVPVTVCAPAWHAMPSAVQPGGALELEGAHIMAGLAMGVGA